MSSLVPYNEVKDMGVAIAKSNLFGIKDPAQAVALMLVAQAEGLHPATAARDYHIVQGKPTLKADAILARHIQSGGKAEWHEYNDKSVIVTFSHPNGGSVKIDWTIERAQKVGLTGNPTWKKYPRNMLRARCISEGVRTVNPGVCCGVYTPEEVEDFDSKPNLKPEVKKAPIETPVEIVEEISKEKLEEKIKNAKAYQHLVNTYKKYKKEYDKYPELIKLMGEKKESFNKQKEGNNAE